MDLTDAILDLMRDDEVYETYPLSGVFSAAEVARGYAGEAYYRDDPRLPVELRRLEANGWHLPVPSI